MSNSCTNYVANSLRNSHINKVRLLIDLIKVPLMSNSCTNYVANSLRNSHINKVRLLIDLIKVPLMSNSCIAEIPVFETSVILRIAVFLACSRR